MSAHPLPRDRAERLVRQIERALVDPDPLALRTAALELAAAVDPGDLDERRLHRERFALDEILKRTKVAAPTIDRGKLKEIPGDPLPAVSPSELLDVAETALSSWFRLVQEIRSLAGEALQVPV